MSAINLLPWRDALKQRQKSQFLAMLGFFSVITLLLVFGVNWFIGESVNEQKQRNQYLQHETRLLDAKIGEINELKKQRKQLIDRVNLIKILQFSRNISVKLFNNLPALVPPGVYLNDLKFNEKRIDVIGDAEGYSRVASMMRNIDSSDWLGVSKISSIVTGKEKPMILSQFSVFFDVLGENQQGKEAKDGSATTQ